MAGTVNGARTAARHSSDVSSQIVWRGFSSAAGESFDAGLPSVCEGFSTGISSGSIYLYTHAAFPRKATFVICVVDLWYLFGYSLIANSKRISEMAEKRTGYLPTFDGWRAVAILAVIVSHLALEGSPSIINTILGNGSRGVDLFFAISGFLVCYSLLNEEQRHGKISVRGFYIRRAFRILPVFLTYLVVIACVTSVNWEAWRAALLLYRNFIPTKTDWNTSHFWSLAVEEHFYLLMPFLFVFTRSRRINAFLGVAALLAIWSLIDSGWHLTAAPEIRYRTDYRLPALLLGCVAAMILSEGHQVLRRIPKPAIAVPAIALLFFSAEFVPKPARFALQAPLFPLMLLSTVLHPGATISRLLQWRPLAMVGRVSYGLYVWQQLFFSAEPNLGAIQRFPLNIVLLTLVVVLSFRWMETPLMNFARVLSTSRRPASPSPQAVQLHIVP
jgi:peptidoglycan/LPS O-acetylase OafA/YrhL